MPPLVSPSPRTPYRTKQDQGGASPCYFGLSLDPTANPFNTSGGRHAKATRSSSSSVRSAAASSPHTISHSSDPKYDAFRRQSETGSFSLSQSGLSSSSGSKVPSRPSPSRTSSKQDKASSSKPVPTQLPKSDTIQEGELMRSDSTRSRSPKRLLSSDTSIFDRNKTASPESFLESSAPRLGSLLSNVHDKHSRLSFSHTPESSNLLQITRAETLPATLDHEGPAFVTPQHVANILDSSNEYPLVLDLRVSTQYAKSRIRGALNLCIPTTLLKRPSYNVRRLAETFKHELQKARFSSWQQSSCIIVYDTNSSQPKDATNCFNILKKFETDGWKGKLYILRGGFLDFSRSFSSFVDEKPFGSPNSSTSTLSLDSQLDLPPVIGGCPIPPSKSAANPFFGNIRQNMDLIGGVGQIPIKLPASMSKQAAYDLPKWLRTAANESDQGRIISEKFLQIEKREQKRMQDALSDSIAFGKSSRGGPRPVQIAGIEKGSKNRYNNIWPYEHSRVRLQGVPAGDCDYVNASWAKTSLSNKRYIATQGPIPQTFSDFWSMVWQADVRVIVMLTAETEGGQVKAHNYWSSKSYGPLKLEFLSEHRASLELAKIHRHRSRSSIDHRRSLNSSSSNSNSGNQSYAKQSSSQDSQPYVIVRKFAVSHEQHPFERIREVTQLQYSSWPDFGAPAHPAHVLGLVEQCDAVMRSLQNVHTRPSVERPVLVHCSAGCGRTGTFCTVDSVVDMLKRQRSMKHKRQGSPMDVSTESTDESSGENEGLQRDDIDLIEKAVEEFRAQRLSMVQSLRQFVLCYEAVLEWVVGQSAPKTA